jgi:hypothetical protein
MKSPTVKIIVAILFLFDIEAQGSHKNNFTFYTPQGHLLRGTSRIQASFARSSTPKSSK